MQDEGAGHSYRDKMEELVEETLEFLTSRFWY